MKALFLAFALLFNTATFTYAQAVPCTTVTELEEQFKDDHQYTIKGEELTRLWESVTDGPLPFSGIFLVLADDNANAVHVAFGLDGCALVDTIFHWPLDRMDEVLTKAGINVLWAKPGI